MEHPNKTIAYRWFAAFNAHDLEGLLDLYADDAQVFMEYVRHVQGEDDMHVGEVLEITNGTIIASRVYHQ